MGITDRAIDQAFSDLKKTCGGVRNDYFGILYLEQRIRHRPHRVRALRVVGWEAIR